MPSDWWDDRSNLALLINHLAGDAGFDNGELGRVVEKPWCYTDEFATAAYYAESAPGAVSGSAGDPS